MVGETTVGETMVGETTVGETTVGETIVLPTIRALEMEYTLLMEAMEIAITIQGITEEEEVEGQEQDLHLIMEIED